VTDGFEGCGEQDAELPSVRGPGADSVPAELPQGPAATVPGCPGWPESVWTPPGSESVVPPAGSGVLEEPPLLFVEPFAEVELRREMRLSELWRKCGQGVCTLDEFFELSALIGEVGPVRGCLCADCAVLGRPNVSGHWALSDTALCRAHLRFRLGQARVDGGGSDPGA
jgi:hypothetical protein